MRLRISQSTAGPDQYRIELSLESPHQAAISAVSTFKFELTPADHEDLRWYLEDYLQYPLDPNPAVADRVEKRMIQIGEQLFQSVFEDNKNTLRLWHKLSDQLNETRIEISTDVREAVSIPWELIRDPQTHEPLALQAVSFVRSYWQSTTQPRLPQTDSGPIRILLVICRPSGSDDVPFRSVASRLIKGLTDQTRPAFHLEVLRPPTFARLAQVLRQAHQEGKPFHVVHFDGHGTYGDFSQKKTLDDVIHGLSSIILYGPARKGPHGYLLFENPTAKENIELIDGPSLGKLLVETNVPLLVLNACRSAHAESPGETQDKPPSPDVPDNIHDKVRAFGSLAQELMDTGVTGVVAMRYNLYVVTAAQFIADLYSSLVRGTSLSQAVSLGRKQLHDQPLRTIAFTPVPLQDWCVPIVYEAASFCLFPQPRETPPLSVSLDAGDSTPDQQQIDPQLPQRPDVGFFGRDETLLALDRAFDNHPIVLLHAYAGSGKTAAAAEFARWYSLTGGIRGPVLFTSFEHHLPLARVLDQIERFFGPALEQIGIHWLTLTDPQRREAALQVLQQVPVLWIWDNIEPIAGFPTGTKSAWTAEEQKELLDFLRDARDTRAKFLLTSRRDEQPWLGDLPRRITVPPMPPQERFQLTCAIAQKHGSSLIDISDWRPLLNFTRGNPLTITVLVGQALRDQLKTKTQIEEFVDKLRSGEAQFTDEKTLGRSQSLGASLNYGFEHTFNNKERPLLALLHFFQGFVNVGVLQFMGNPDEDWSLPELHGLTRNAGLALLDRAAEIGLLTALGDGYYSIHPALPWFFRKLFDQYYPSTTPPDSPSHNPLSVARAFVESIGFLSNHYFSQYECGNRAVIDLLRAEEANLLHARRLARRNQWWFPVIGAMQGLNTLYDHTGRHAEWSHLVEEIIPDFIDPDTDGPLPGQEKLWSLVTQYRVLLSQQTRQWPEAERLLKILVEWYRRSTIPSLQLSPDKLNNFQRNDIRTLSVSLHELGQIQRELQKPECITSYEESLELDKKFGTSSDAAVTAFNLGHTYKDINSLRDLDKAEYWYQQSLDLREEHDNLGRAKCLGQLGLIAYERFKDARSAQKPPEKLLALLQSAEQYYLDALDLIPTDAANDLAVAHNQLGNIYYDAGGLDRALPHWQQSIRYEENQGNLYGAAQTRYNVALALAQAGRFTDALAYAHAALRNYQTFGDRAAADIQKSQALINDIEQAINNQEDKS